MLFFLKKIKSFFQTNWLEALVNFYKSIPSLYKTTFWTVFIALNIVFAYHTAHFIWGNHEWVYMRHGITWRQFWYEARFTETIPYALFGFELLPILLNQFAFAGISMSMLALAIYWKLPKEKWIFLSFCLMMAFIPYNLSWLYHVAQSSFLWGTSIIVLALTILENIYQRKISFWWNFLVIFLLWFVLGFNAAFINTIFICFIGRCLIDLYFNKEIISLIKKGCIGLFDIVTAGLLLKGTIALLNKYGFLGTDFYNVNTIKLSEVWTKLQEVARYCLEQFTITYPFFEKPCLFMMWTISVLALITMFWCLPKKRWWLNCCILLTGIVGILFASQLAIFISENRIKLQFMFRLTGFFSLYFIFALMLSFLCQFWKKTFLKNFLFVLVLLITGLFIQRDMYAMRVWKQGLDAENKLYDRVIDRMEEQPDFNYSKRYRLVIVGDPSLRDRYYKGTHKDKDASVLGWSYRAPWTYQAYLNFYAPQDFVRGYFQDAWGLKYTEQLFTYLSEESINEIIEQAAPWPAPGSVMIKDNIILVFINSGETNIFKKLLADYKQERLSFTHSNYPRTIQVSHPAWENINTLKFITMERIMRSWSGDVATVLEFDNQRLVLKWDDFGTETFIKNSSDIYELVPNEKSNMIGSSIILASHKEWLPAWEPQKLQFISKNKIVRVANQDIAVVKKFTNDELILDWYAYGTEYFKKDKNGVYRFYKKE